MDRGREPVRTMGWGSIFRNFLQMPFMDGPLLNIVLLLNENKYKTKSLLQ